MTDLSFSIPESMLHWLEQRAAAGDYVDIGDLLRDLVRREQGRTERTRWLREQIAEGLASGMVDGEPEDLIEGIIAARKARHG
jgi:Arc/MetJ-type ribon-helix-helix transcriptional regulator